MDKPRVVILGASRNRAKYGNKSVRAHLRRGYTVYPVNPHCDQIEGLPCFRSIRDVPGPMDRVSVYLPAELTLEMLPEISALRPGELWLNPGAESPALVERARELGLRVVVGCSIVDLGLSPDQFDDR